MPKKDFLLEIGTEELPPKSLQTLSQALLHGIEMGLHEKGLNFIASKGFAAPRRLGILIEALDTQQPEQQVERRGPAVQAAYDASGQPSRAALGFAKSCGVEFTMLQTQKTEKGEWLYYSATLPGRASLDLLGEIVVAAIKKLPLSKPMRWGDHAIEFIRPVHWVLMLLGKAIVPAEVLGKKADRFTYGHRFHFPHAIKIQQAQDYEATLEKKAFVIPDFAKRKQHIVEAIKRLATESNGLAFYTETLLHEVTALVEYPIVLRASFADQFLQIPQEVLIAAMQGHQKSFPIYNADGTLLPYFIFVANLKSKDPQRVIAGNEKVMHARLSDAAFFYQSDLKTPLIDYRPQLKNVVFQEKLGDLLARSERIAALSEKIAIEINAPAEQAKRAGLLCKCDLMTDMVYEFPELQGIIGSYYALHAGETTAVATAIKQHYQPEFSGDDLPDEAIAICVALADKLDLLVGIFGVGKRPSGDKDPFGLRRAAIGVVRILVEKQLNIELSSLLSIAVAQYSNLENQQTEKEVIAYIFERLKYWYIEQGSSIEVFNAVIAKSVTNLHDFDQRMVAVKQFSILPAAVNLAAANKRVSNILKKNNIKINDDRVDEKLLHEAAEKDLYVAIENQRATIAPLLQAKDYTAVLNTLATLQPPIDSFFDRVMVMAEDPTLKRNRLLLLNNLRNLFLTIADIAQLS